jgi:GT2 family glycosyltransferase
MEELIPRVSIAIVNWNTKDLLENCLSSVFSETGSIPIEVIVADNGSKDGSCEMVKEKFGQVKLIENNANLGFAKANNQCFEISRGEYVLMLNSDTVILDRAIEKTVAFADSYKEGAAFGCRLLYPDGRFQNSCFRTPSILGLILTSLRISQVFKNNYYLNWDRYGCHDQGWSTPTEVECVMGSFILLRNSVLKQVGYLDTDFFMYAEESDLCYRIYNNGYKVIYYPDAIIFHVHGGSKKTAEDAAWSYMANFRGVLKFMYKWKPTTAYISNIIIALFTFPRMIGWAAADLMDAIKAGRFKKKRLLKADLLPFHFRSMLKPSTMAEKWGRK